MDPVLRSTEPALLQIFQDDLRLRLGAGDVAGIGDGYAKGASQQAAQVCGRVCELVLFIVAVLQGDEDAQVVCAGNDANVGARELCAQLVEAAGNDALGGAVDVEGGDGGMVGRLLGQVRHLDELVAGDAGGGAGGLRAGRVLERRLRVLDLPVAAEELAQGRVVGLAWLALDVFLPALAHAATAVGKVQGRTKSLVNQKRSVPSMRPRASSESPMLINVSGRSR